jgi:hypothetical protein
MAEVNEEKIYNSLLKFKGNKQVSIGEAEVDLSINPTDIHNIDSPDYLLWLNISIKLYGQELKVRVPVPVEAEKGGIYGGALEDLRKFVERKKYPIEIPMLVIAEAGFETTTQTEPFPVKFTINQIPVRLTE